MPSLYLHIGRGKTGTTLIQRYLAEKREELLAQGVHYVAAGGGEMGTGHQEFAKSFVTSAPDFMERPADTKAICSAVLDELSEARPEIAVMSSENFAIADIDELLDFLRLLPVPYQIKVIFFVRSQDEMAESEYNQVVKLAGVTVSLDDYVNESIEGCDYFQVAESWSKHCGAENMICRVYDGRSRNVISQFLECIPEIDATKLSDDALKRCGSAANSAIGIRALWIARTLNSVEIPRRMSSYTPVYDLLSDKDLPALLWNSQQAAEFRARFFASNLAFSTRYLDAPFQDLGGRRYTDAERDQIVEEIAVLRRQLS